ncbi:MAG: hypothetical protein KAR31_03545, partial [Candidatus Omnitrophica bacterium]|nr:hypothetical protein [Candidatus Omnitrophota bacterium]
MIETPEAVKNIDEILACPLIKFISFGTNDLIRFLYKVDRTDPEQYHEYYKKARPLVAKIIRNITSKANGEGVDVSICGDVADSREFWIVWHYLRSKGIHLNLSMPAPSIRTFKTWMLLMDRHTDEAEFKEADAFLAGMFSEGSEGIDAGIDLLNELLQKAVSKIESLERGAARAFEENEKPDNKNPDNGKADQSPRATMTVTKKVMMRLGVPRLWETGIACPVIEETGLLPVLSMLTGAKIGWKGWLVYPFVSALPALLLSTIISIHSPLFIGTWMLLTLAQSMAFALQHRRGSRLPAVWARVAANLAVVLTGLPGAVLAHAAFNFIGGKSGRNTKGAKPRLACSKSSSLVQDTGDSDDARDPDDAGHSSSPVSQSNRRSFGFPLYKGIMEIGLDKDTPVNSPVAIVKEGLLHLSKDLPDDFTKEYRKIAILVQFVHELRHLALDPKADYKTHKEREAEFTILDGALTWVLLATHEKMSAYVSVLRKKATVTSGDYLDQLEQELLAIRLYPTLSKGQKWKKGIVPGEVREMLKQAASSRVEIKDGTVGYDTRARLLEILDFMGFVSSHEFISDDTAVMVRRPSFWPVVEKIIKQYPGFSEEIMALEKKNIFIVWHFPQGRFLRNRRLSFINNDFGLLPIVLSTSTVAGVVYRKLSNAAASNPNFVLGFSGQNSDSVVFVPLQESIKHPGVLENHHKLYPPGIPFGSLPSASSPMVQQIGVPSGILSRLHGYKESMRVFFEKRDYKSLVKVLYAISEWIRDWRDEKEIYVILRRTLEDNEKLDFMQKIGTMVGFIDMWADKEIQRRELLQQMLDDIYEKLMTMMDDVIALLSQGRVPVVTDDKNKLVVARWFIEEALTVQAVVAELRPDMAMDGGRPGRLREFVVQHLALKERFAGRSREYLEECFSARRIARRIADLFHLAEQHQFNVFSLLGKEARACWVGKDDGRKIEYNFTLSPEGVLSMAEVDSSGRTRPIAFFSQSPYFLDNPADQRLNIDNFLMKTLGFVAWARRQEERVTIVITSKEGRIAELADHYAEMGFDVIPKARDLQSSGVKAFFWNLRIGYMGLYGGLDASILTGRQATIIPALRPPGWKKWSQRQLDGYMKKIAPWLDEGVSSSPLSVDPVRRDKRPVLR